MGLDMTVTHIIGRDTRLNVYLFSHDFSEYLMEMSMQTKEELWGLLKDYIKEECHGRPRVR